MTPQTSCPYCAAPLPEDPEAHFCPSCGELLLAQDLATTVATPALVVGKGMTIPMSALDPAELNDTAAHPQLQRHDDLSPLHIAARALKQTEQIMLAAPDLAATQVLAPLTPDADFNIDISPTYADDLQAQERVVASAPDRGALEVAHLETQILSSVSAPPTAHAFTALLQPLTPSAATAPRPSHHRWLWLLALTLVGLALLAAAIFFYLLLTTQASPSTQHNASAPPHALTSGSTPLASPTLHVHPSALHTTSSSSDLPRSMTQHNAMGHSSSSTHPLSPPDASFVTFKAEGERAILSFVSLQILDVPAPQAPQTARALQEIMKAHHEGRGDFITSACDLDLCVIWRRPQSSRRIELTRLDAPDPQLALFQAQYISDYMTNLMDLLVLNLRPGRPTLTDTSWAATAYLNINGEAPERIAALSNRERRALAFTWPAALSP